MGHTAVGRRVRSACASGSRSTFELLKLVVLPQSGAPQTLCSDVQHRARWERANTLREVVSECEHKKVTRPEASFEVQFICIVSVDARHFSEKYNHGR